MHSSVIIIAMLFLLLNLRQKYVQFITLQSLLPTQKFMKIEERLAAFVKLGKFLSAIDEAAAKTLEFKIENENPWFTPGSVELALQGLIQYLNAEKLQKWVADYQLEPAVPKTV